ncbi:MAG: hypothetical protein H7A46_08580 [Verrucomicrobiales bacterium]|nr:hypothetical protein [Verrucomicrobiales bacterium]
MALPTGGTFSPGWHEVARMALRTPGPVARTALAFASEPVAVEVSDAAATPLSTTLMNGSLTTTPRPVDVDQLPDLLPSLRLRPAWRTWDNRC